MKNNYDSNNVPAPIGPENVSLFENLNNHNLCPYCEHTVIVSRKKKGVLKACCLRCKICWKGTYKEKIDSWLFTEKDIRYLFPDNSE
jgi:hypothetical protein